LGEAQSISGERTWMKPSGLQRGPKKKGKQKGLKSAGEKAPRARAFWKGVG